MEGVKELSVNEDLTIFIINNKETVQKIKEFINSKKEITIEQKFEACFNNGFYFNEIFTYDEERGIHTINGNIPFKLYLDYAEKNHKPSIMALGIYNFDCGQYTIAETWFSKIDNNRHRDYWLALSMFEQGKSSQDIIDLLLPYKHSMSNRMFKILAYAYQRNQQFLNACGIFWKLIEEKYDLEHTTINYINCLKNYKAGDAIDVSYKSIYDIYPEFPNIENILADIYYKEDDIEKAIDFYEKAYEKKEDPEIAVQLVKCYAKLKKPDHMIKYANMM